METLDDVFEKVQEAFEENKRKIKVFGCEGFVVGRYYEHSSGQKIKVVEAIPDKIVCELVSGGKGTLLLEESSNLYWREITITEWLAGEDLSYANHHKLRRVFQGPSTGWPSLHGTDKVRA
jgi:hypothetical protein